VRRPGQPGVSDTAPRIDRVEIVATVLLALAAVATAWSSYQASRWNGEQAKAFSRGNTARIESTRASGLADAQSQIDVATFTQWANAYALGEKQLADFYFRRFRLEFKPAVEAWIATRPLRNAAAPLTPFAMPEYKLAARAEADRMQTEADAYSAAGRTDVQRATNYVLACHVRGRPLLRGDDHEAARTAPTDRPPRPRSSNLHRRRRLARDAAHQYLGLSLGPSRARCPTSLELAAPARRRLRGPAFRNDA
jgi:hypothetical protein